MKRGRDQQPLEIRQRLRDIIVKIGDKKIGDPRPMHLTNHIEDLTVALKPEFENHRSLIIETVLDCARSLPTKSSVYATLTGLLNAADNDIGGEIVEAAHRELQDAFETHAPMAIRGLTRFVCGLMSARTIASSSVVELLGRLLDARESVEDETVQGESGQATPLARADWFAVVVMDALVLCGKELAAEAPEALAGLLASLDEQATRRRPLRETGPLLLPYGAATAPDEFVEHFDALHTIVTTMREDGGWSSPFLVAPHRAFASRLAEAPMHRLRPIVVPAHTSGCTYPAFHRLRLLQSASAVDRPMVDSMDAPIGDADADEADEMQTDEMGRDVRVSVRRQPPALDRAAGRGGGGGGGGRGSELLAPADRLLLEEHVFMLVLAFAESHTDCAKQLQGLGEQLQGLGLDQSQWAAMIVEVLLSYLLALPAPKHKVVMHTCVIVDLCKNDDLPAVQLALEAALNVLFTALPRLDTELVERLASWLALHLSHFGFSEALKIFARPWGDALGVPYVSAAAVPEAAGPRERFVQLTLDHMTRLSYLERVEMGCPEVFWPYLPPPTAQALRWWCDVGAEGCLRPTEPTRIDGRWRPDYSADHRCWHLNRSRSRSIAISARRTTTRHLNHTYMVCEVCYRAGRAEHSDELIELPSTFKGRLDWGHSADGGGAPGSPAALSEELLVKLRAKLTNEQVISWLDRAPPPFTSVPPADSDGVPLPVEASPERVALVVQTLIDAGTMSIRHLERLLEKYGELLRLVSASAADKVELLSAVWRYWSASPQMQALLLSKLRKHKVIDGSTLLAFAFHPDGRGGLGQGGWEAVNELVESVVLRQRDATQVLRRCERRLAGLVAEGMDDAAVGQAEAEVAEARVELDDARRQKKETLANLFAGACGLLGAHEAAAKGASGMPRFLEWYRMTLGRTLALGRRYASEFSLDTVEIVVEGNGVAESVRDLVFPPLRQVQAYTG